MINRAPPKFNDWEARASAFSYGAMPWIDGKTVPGMECAVYDKFSPRTGAKIAAIPSGTTQDAQRAVSSCKAAFRDGRWANLAPQRRRETLFRFARLIEDSAEDLALLDCIDVGKPIVAALSDVAWAVEYIRYAAGAIDKLLDDVVPTHRQSLTLNVHEPVGVVGAIVPWNYPLFIAAQKLAPALAWGNSVVLKPSELSPLSALALARLAKEAGIPDGVLNVVPGLGSTVGQAIVDDDDVALITFTGSTPTGRKIMQASAPSLRKVILECGGKSPHIVFADIADLEAVADDVVDQITTNQGQLCVAGARLLVEESLHDKLVEAVVTRMNAIVPGDPLDPATTYGPLVSEAHLGRVRAYVEESRLARGTLIAGGQRIDRPGFYMEPTVIDRPQPDSRLCQEEIFGPVLAILSFRDVTEALHLATRVRYGLAARVWTQDVARAYCLAREIGAGEITINAASPRDPGAGPASAMEPFGQSGQGIEGGLDGMRQFTRRKAITLNLA